MIPTFLMVALLAMSGFLKISGHHPMILHFVQLGIDGWLPVLGSAEILFALLYLFPSNKPAWTFAVNCVFRGCYGH